MVPSPNLAALRSWTLSATFVLWKAIAEQQAANSLLFLGDA